jgi:hypothetical protein
VIQDVGLVNNISASGSTRERFSAFNFISPSSFIIKAARSGNSDVGSPTKSMLWNLYYSGDEMMIAPSWCRLGHGGQM